MEQYKSVYTKFNRRGNMAVLYVSKNNYIGNNLGGYLDVKPFPLPAVPVPKTSFSETETFTKYGGESAELFLDRIRLTQMNRTSRILREQTTQLLRSSMKNRGKTETEINRLVLHMERLNKNLTRFGFPGPTAPMDGMERPSVKELMEQFQLIGELAGIEVREPTLEETIDFMGSGFAEHSVKMVFQADNIEKNAPEKATELGRRGYEDEEEDERRTKRKTSSRMKFIGEENDDSDDEEDKNDDTTTLDGISKKVKEDLKLTKVLRFSEGAPDVMTKVNSRNDTTDDEYEKLLDNLAEEEAGSILPVEIQKNAFRKLKKRYLPERMMRAATRMTPVKWAILKRYMLAPVILGGAWVGWMYYLSYNKTGVEKVLSDLDKAQKDVDQSISLLKEVQERGENISKTIERLKKNAEELNNKIAALGNLSGSNNVKDVEKQLNELAELFDSGKGVVSQAVKKLKEAGEKLQDQKFTESAEKLSSWFDKILKTNALTRNTIIDKIIAGEQITEEVETIVQSVNLDIANIKTKNSGNISRLSQAKKASQSASNTLTAVSGTLTSRVRSLLWADSISDLATRVTGSVDPRGLFLTRAAIEVTVAPLRAAEMEIFARYSVNVDLLRTQIKDFVWQSAEMAANWWMTFTQLSLYQWFARLKPNSIPDILKKQKEEQRVDDTILLALSSMWTKYYENKKTGVSSQWYMSPSELLRASSWTWTIPYIQSTGWLFSMVASTFSFITMLQNAMAYATSVSIGIPLVGALSLPLVLSYFGRRNMGDIIRDAAIRGGGLTSGVAKYLRTSLETSQPQRVLGFTMEFLISSANLDFKGVGAMTMSYLGFTTLIWFVSQWYGMETINFWFHLIQSEQIGEYMVAFYRLLEIETKCLQQADNAFSAAKQEEIRKQESLSNDDLLELQEKVLDECRRMEIRGKELRGKQFSFEFWEGIKRYGTKFE